MEEKIKLGISSCLLGEKVRYDGGHCLDHFLVHVLGQYVEYVPVCPEVELGLPVPREALCLVKDADAETPRLVTKKTGIDYTRPMLTWAQSRLDSLEKEKLCGFIFKNKSPSCGMERIKVYKEKEKGGVEKNGVGIFAGAFMERFPGLPVEDESRLRDMVSIENFILELKFPVARLLGWYRKNKRDLPWRKTTDIYAVWVSEIMLQQTQVAAVIPYYLRFMQRLPTVEHLARATEQEVLKLWEGLGYYTRVRNLLRAARRVVAEYQGRIPQTLKEFRGLPGVGPYVAAAVLSIARGMMLPAVDGNVMRVYTRYGAIPGDIRKTSTRNRVFKDLQAVIPAEAPGDFNQAVMELGAVICTPRSPQCAVCPLGDNCRAYNTQTIEQYPFKSPPRGTPAYNVSIGIILKGNKFYIQERPSEGHLGGLWEFPGGKAREGETAEEAVLRECKEELGTGIEIIKKLAVVDHAYSHFKIHMSVFVGRLAGEDGGVSPSEGQPFRWITVSELENYPFPGANHKFFAELREFLSTIFRRSIVKKRDRPLQRLQRG